MLAGVTQRSDSDPYDATSPSRTAGTQWMIMWLFDPKTTGLPTTQADRRVHHVGRIAVRAYARHGVSIKRFSMSGVQWSWTVVDQLQATPGGRKEEHDYQ
jgi:hypothetical protein